MTTIRRGLLAMLLAVAAVALPANAATASAASPTLALTQFCDDYPPFSGIAIDAAGLPPSSVFHGRLEWVYDNSSDGGSVEGDLLADENGAFHVTFGSEVPATYTVTIDWSGGHLQQTLHSDCSAPPPPPVWPETKSDCKRGGWRNYDFNSQRHCVKWVKRHRHHGHHHR